MDNKPVLVVMAAGMGSRYGGLKQIDGMGPNGEIIIDYSLYDAKRAGFEKVICIIKHEIEEDFKAIMNRGAAKHLDIEYAYQQLDDLPEGYSLPEGREKPWGTSHAIRAARDLVKGPFAVINADDYYGPGVYKTMYDYLCTACDKDGVYDFSMMGYKLENTLTEAGTVARGVCVDKDGYLTDIEERLKIGWKDGKIAYTEDDGESWTEVPMGTTVSMNFFGFTPSIMKELDERFPAFLDKALKENPLKGEYLIPKTVGELIHEGKATVKILPSEDKWFGVTYRQDKEAFVKAINEKIAEGVYPSDLWA
ncbi:MAG: nucleotidyltransferase [Firmicutes bacterium]|nr:nucleotidyltransferase [Bacillota bacterium]